MSYQSDFRPELNSQPYHFIREIFTDERTEEKIHRHLEVRDDEISEDDLQNIKTEMTATSTEQGIV